MIIDQPHATVDILASQERAGSRELHGRIGMAAVGLILTGAAALSTRAATRLLFATTGGLLFARGLTGLSLERVREFTRSLLRPRADLERRFNDGEHDIVDAASFDSFPASDPPSYSPGNG